MNVEDNMEIVEDENVNEMFMCWNRNEIQFYYHLMLHRIGEKNVDDENHAIEHDMWRHSACKHVFEEIDLMHEQPRRMEVLLEQIKKLWFES